MRTFVPQKLTRVIVTEILPLATVLFAFGPQVCVDQTLFVRLQDDAEDLLAGPQSHGLMDTQTSFLLLAGQDGVIQKARHYVAPSLSPAGAA